eukprot:CAMPEP_0174243896 /NCGR_PEP_ID=MMETSP0417-20130205/33255_1 /TAXON_ID=242541 /ORGANISM="Mayorella sp, Strain BSH-02190019" /LENGTH=219 /DNA_ID=CAMNT_0015323493 /DNA_START=41 /DNA_END=700 /DNA_ORIENTATION=+
MGANSGKPSRVFQSLYIGGEPVLDDPVWFETNGVTHVVSMCWRTVGDDVAVDRKNILHLDVADVPSVDILPLLDQTTLFIHKARLAGGRVFVHCSAGVSRSSTVVIAYLMGWLDVPFARALEILSWARPVVNPNLGFQHQLLRWERSSRLAELKTTMAADRTTSSLYESDLGTIEDLCAQTRRSAEKSARQRQRLYEQHLRRQKHFEGRERERTPEAID